ncbi:thiamine pyrophosphate-binding protein [Actinomadura sp. 9N215]|uniref:thiamine pyrophosphate-binding protein n=1 Tax=Actinomadura sp. 9N215 TaxID=3375150 RepID=UPI0037BEF550
MVQPPVTTTVSEALGTALARQGADVAFGVVGSGNFHITNALIAGGMRFVAARHEGGAATMADAYARARGSLGVLSVHQGPGLTNALTGITEAAKSRTPLLVLAGETAAGAVGSNFRIDQWALAASVGAVPDRIHSPETAADDLARACRTALSGRTVVLNLPLDVQAAAIPVAARAPALRPRPPMASPAAVAELADLLAAARRPVFVGGRGAWLAGAGAALRELAEATGALLATSVVARGLFTGDPFDLGVSGGFATPLAAELIEAADLLVGWGCSLNRWTLAHGTLVGADAKIVQVDVDELALSRHVPADLGVVGDVAETARAVAAELARRGHRSTGRREPKLAERISREGRWRDLPYDDDSDGARIDPRTLSIALDDLLPDERTITIDSGHHLGYPSAFLSVPQAGALLFTQSFQSVGLGLSTAVGAALARPGQVTVAAIGDGGVLMGIADLETAARLGLGLLIVVYDDEAYGAEVHHFGPGGHPLDTVTFPPADVAAIARGFGCEGITVRRPEDLAPVANWLAGPRNRPLLVDAKVTSSTTAWWLKNAFSEGRTASCAASG